MWLIEVDIVVIVIRDVILLVHIHSLVRVLPVTTYNRRYRPLGHQ
jgi:hypothetical protein